MDRGLRVDVVKGEGEFVFIDLLRGDFPTQDLREDVVVVIGKGRIDRHVQPPLLRDAFSAMPDVPSRRSSSAITSAGSISMSASRTWNIGRAHVCTPVTHSHFVCRL